MKEEFKSQQEEKVKELMGEVFGGLKSNLESLESWEGPQVLKVIKSTLREITNSALNPPAATDAASPEAEIPLPPEGDPPAS